ncbi:sel1 repeat family protein [Saccharobesus litoralis]|uniref:Sel1 repeat family protein n=1 Tax=Saccharobesus litoralis TaxID=2172099 RepID=A0A2S0VPL0_9ALTE|nr:tetratricopeptide repeat protein [Saccharobesus litoralis]AWB66155.1 sel1 repeat family protein [Saccharobesus litoralis]
MQFKRFFSAGLGLLLFSSSALADLEAGIDAANFGDFLTARAEFEALVEKNYAPAMYHLAELYAKGLGVAKDPSKALALYTQAADLQLPEAIFKLGVMYKEGIGVERDLAKAVFWFKRAALKDMVAAQFNLGVMYSNGQGVTRDYKQAFDWYVKAASNNSSSAQFNLALMYYEGKGVRKSVKHSYIWNTIAAYNGHLDAKKSKKIDQRSLNEQEIKQAKSEADSIYWQIKSGKYYGPSKRH